MKIKEWEKTEEWKIGDTKAVRFYNPKLTKTMQISKYRKADEYDKTVGQKYDWHGKWYVNVWNPEQEKLFKTKKQAFSFAKKFMKSGQRSLKKVI